MFGEVCKVPHKSKNGLGQMLYPEVKIAGLSPKKHWHTLAPRAFPYLIHVLKACFTCRPSPNSAPN